MDEYILVPSNCTPYDEQKWLGLMHDQIKKDTGLELRLDTELALLDRFVPLLESGQKTTTVRYAKEKIRVPTDTILTLFETMEEDKNYKLAIGSVYIPTMVVKTVGELTDHDGKSDGFSGKDELINVLERFYGKLKPEEFVSIYNIAQFDNFRKF